MATRKPKQPKTRWISVAVQDGYIRSRFSSFQGRLKKQSAIWRGELQPQIVSSVYEIEIRYKYMGVPKVRILSPSLIDNPPHVYSDGTLCLFWPKEWRWGAQELIADTILPWTALWLYYYELWLDTGKWLGPSSHDELDAPNADIRDDQLF